MIKATSAILAGILCVGTFIGCDNEEADLRKALYEASQNAVRDRMRIPKSTTFPAMPSEFEVTAPNKEHPHMKMHTSDSVQFWVMHHAATVNGFYESQNAMGTMLPGAFEVMLSYDSAADTWKPLKTTLNDEE